MRELTPKQKSFVDEYLIDLNATQAVLRSEYKVTKSNADKLGPELLGNTRVAAAIQKAMDKRSKRTEITADNVLKELAKIGFGNIQNLYDDKGALLHPQDLPREVAATIQEVTEETSYDKDGDPTHKRKYKVSDKKASLELLGKHLKLFTDKLEIGGGLTLKRVRKKYDGTVDDGD